ncbi:hypothetical protein GCM10010358_19220 [Streptomyces minutiscleroticus]|uniref:DUF397 domain-containing protein n=1 Tax=Streptomyces minutiscleroticus TaxID=68238 RepID=A0A918KIY1_9ACTN|nr:DUF397 domain-containing protein [Streptomyces minutiscleroticus]GGX65002.1 hypothetical protein GCM10010358_19220 [Streptomyces minutiscleroticus]
MSLGLGTDRLPESAWFKSSYSGGNETECVECARVEDDVLVRDSKRGEGPVLVVRGPAWNAFTRALLDGRMKG